MKAEMGAKKKTVFDTSQPKKEVKVTDTLQVQNSLEQH